MKNKALLSLLVIAMTIVFLDVKFNIFSKFNLSANKQEKKTQEADVELTGDSKKIPTIDWKLLYQLDYKTGNAPESVKSLDGKLVKIAGFIVPLSDNYNVLDEFLLVPNGQACIHVPPPPPNLIIYVKLKKPLPFDVVFNPSWAIGVLRIKTSSSQFGSASYSMEGEGLEKFSYKR